MKKVFAILAVSLITALSVQAETPSKDLVSIGKKDFSSFSPRTIGLRIGYGAAFVYQQNVGANMVSVDIEVPGISRDLGLGAAVTYDFINPFDTKIPWKTKGLWNWYLGAGLRANFNSRHDTGDYMGMVIHDKHKEICAGIVGRVGIEYEFWFPVQLALEYRPTIGISFQKTDHYLEDMNHNIGNQRTSTNTGFYTAGLFAGAIALCVRYKF